MKKLLFLLLLLSVSTFGKSVTEVPPPYAVLNPTVSAQITNDICAQPMTTVAHLHDWLMFEDSACTATKKITLADFLVSLGISVDTSVHITGFLKSDGSVTGATTFTQTFQTGVASPIYYDDGSGVHMVDNSGVGVGLYDKIGGDTITMALGIINSKAVSKVTANSPEYLYLSKYNGSLSSHFRSLYNNSGAVGFTQFGDISNRKNGTTAKLNDIDSSFLIHAHLKLDRILNGSTSDSALVISNGEVKKIASGAKCDSLKRSADSVFCQKNGVWYFQYLDSVGGLLVADTLERNIDTRYARDSAISAELSKIATLGTPYAKLLGKSIGVDFNTTSDQLITLSGGSTFIITDIVITNPSVSIVALNAEFHPMASRGGAYMARSDNGAEMLAYLTASTDYINNSASQALKNSPQGLLVNNSTISNSLYFSLGSTQGSAATADIYVFGFILN